MNTVVNHRFCKKSGSLSEWATVISYELSVTWKRWYDSWLLSRRALLHEVPWKLETGGYHVEVVVNVFIVVKTEAERQPWVVARKAVGGVNSCNERKLGNCSVFSYTSYRVDAVEPRTCRRCSLRLVFAADVGGKALLLRNPKFRFRHYKTFFFNYVWRFRPAHTLTAHCCKVYFNIIFPCVSK